MTFEEQMQGIYIRKAELEELAASYNAKAARAAFRQVRDQKRVSDMILHRTKSMNRPCITLGAQIEQRGNKFVATFSGLSVEGESPEIAFQEFDRLWSQGESE